MLIAVCAYFIKGDGKWRRPKCGDEVRRDNFKLGYGRGRGRGCRVGVALWGHSGRRSVPSSAALRGRRQAKRRRQSSNRSEILLPASGRSRQPRNRRPKSLRRRDLRARRRPRSGSNNPWVFWASAPRASARSGCCHHWRPPAHERGAPPQGFREPTQFITRYTAPDTEYEAAAP